MEFHQQNKTVDIGLIPDRKRAFFPDSCHNSYALASKKPHTIFYSVPTLPPLPPLPTLPMLPTLPRLPTLPMLPIEVMQNLEGARLRL